MNEQDQAAFYQAHKDDPTVWGDAEERDRPRPRRSLDETITVRLSSEESEMLRTMAEAKGVSYSEIMRKALKAFAGSGRPLEEAVWTLDYRMWSRTEVPQPQIDFGAGFKKGPKVSTGSRVVR